MKIRLLKRPHIQTDIVNTKIKKQLSQKSLSINLNLFTYIGNYNMFKLLIL